MSNQERQNTRPPDGTPTPADGTPRTGEGADTALQVLIRKRRLVESPPPLDPLPPAPPLS